ncbi:dTDP-4-dehydrorhamnose 3,5-epimerase [Ensifer sp. M14]|uniref:dTDP-4-dehydrorhamnose 3,5-epimerase family protein n=1 Tax=Ensifer sp. M14 TaxID=2203782 RepID=UPI000E1CDEBA|nr:dTDP-4-dehydrorhamnose 3,5-epimerase family protein [Ensifer sp. M14]RDL48930.1 dTDP-4-dehydrorhamnose 3,5-epimerase [Ensifer sp. M14]
MSRFTVIDLPLAGLKLVERQNHGDSRGFLSRMFCADELGAAGWLKPIAQINLTMTAKKGAIRGMHFQHPPHAEMKLVSCVRGAVLDVAVDLRAGSPTFLKSHAQELSAENRRALLIPEGFAHGFQALTTDCELLYLHSMPYIAGSEGALHAQDPALGIAWPLEIAEMSERDQKHPYLTDQFAGLTP